MELLVCFESTHQALYMEKVLKSHNIEFDIIPTPREITSSCGLSIKADDSVLKRLLQLIDDNDIEIMGIYKIVKNGEKFFYEKMR